MKKVLADIQSGDFAREWIAENRAGQENFQRMRKEQQGHQVEKVGERAAPHDALDRRTSERPRGSADGPRSVAGAQSLDRRLPPDPGDPALPLAGGMVLAGHAGRDRQLDRDADPGHAVADAAPVPRRVRALCRAPGGLPDARRRPVSRASPGARAATRSTWRSPSPGRRTAGSPGSACSSRSRRSLLADTLVGFGSTAAGGGYSSAGVAATAAFLGWFYCLARGRMAEGLRNAAVYGIGYTAQVYGYLFFFTQRYPNSDPASYEFANVYRADPIRLTVADDLRRSRLTTFFRLLLAIPHIVWLLLWGIVGLLRGARERGRDGDPRHVAAGAAQLPGAVPALPDPRLRVPAARGQSVPRLHRAGRAATRSTSRSRARSARTGGSRASGCSSRSRR